jgi:hypothetical protein
MPFSTSSARPRVKVVFLDSERKHKLCDEPGAGCHAHAHPVRMSYRCNDRAWACAPSAILPFLTLTLGFAKVTSPTRYA